MTRTGTCHFRGIASAAHYYAEQGQYYTPQEIQGKIARGEIKIGPPEAPTGSRVRVDQDGRYWIEEPDARPAGADLRSVG